MGRNTPASWFCFSLFLLFPVLAHAFQAPGPIRAGIFHNPPVCFMDEQGEAAGIYPDLVNLIAKVEGWEVEYVEDTWTGCLENLGAGGIDIMTSIVRTRERERVFDFSKQPVVTAWGQVFTGRRASAASILDLDGKRVGVLKKDVSGANFIRLARRFNLAPVIVPCETWEALCRRMESGEVVAGVMYNIGGGYLKRRFAVYPTPIVFEPVNGLFAVQQGQNRYLLDRIDIHLSQLKQDKNSAYYAILEKWYGEPESQSPFPVRTILFICLSAAVILLCLSVWNLMLKRQVRFRTKALGESEERFRQLVENIKEVFWIVSPDLKAVHYVSPGYTQFYGRPLKEIYTNPRILMEFVHPDDRSRVVRHFDRGIRERVDEDYRILNIDGTYRWSRNRAFPVVDREGNLTRIVGVTEDITARKNAEKARRINEKRYRELFSHMPGGVVVCTTSDDGRSFRVKDLNTAARMITGIVRSEAIGKDAGDVFPGVGGAGILERVKRVWQTGQKIYLPEVHYRDHRLNLWLEQSIYKLPSGEIVSVFHDITEQKMLQAEALRTGHLASIGELAAGVAHEINNPVTGIISLAEILADRFERLGGEREIPERIINEGERISRIVRNLLSFARVKNDGHGPTDINDVLGLTLELTEKQLLRDGIRISLDLAGDLPLIKANDQEIQQVFLNLVSNARYALNHRFQGPDQGKRLEISTRAADENGRPCVRAVFRDSGAGIPESILGAVTDPFFSTKPRGEGTGLGLSISHGIIKNHGGRLLFESREGAFTRVVVELPENPETPGEDI